MGQCEVPQTSQSVTPRYVQYRLLAQREAARSVTEYEVQCRLVTRFRSHRYLDEVLHRIVKQLEQIFETPGEQQRIQAVRVHSVEQPQKNGLRVGLPSGGPNTPRSRWVRTRPNEARVPL